ncbi:four-carbon acid sugar kinase family protein [Virgibacillus kekensis]|uniref:Four-carbon acid sugar kinase family protein n=1 Tax=Virgibacillus kekensis TaxID=202261 RepID=A0ABV9DHI2_9BACI
MKQRIGIIADDLTGANDSGVQLTEKGINTSVLFDIPENHENLDSGIVIDTNSRALSREKAALITEKAGRFLKEAGFQHIYKKMDSTLRGHIGTELHSLYDVFQPEFVFIAPAFPSMGRTTRDGIHYVNGVEIAETEISRDPKHPVKESFIPSILEKEIGQPVGLLTKDDIESDISVFWSKINEFKGNNINYIVCDAEIQEDLQQAAMKMASISSKVIWAGSAGLAQEIPEVLGIVKKNEELQLPVSNKVMTVCGSLSAITQKQVSFAVKQSGVTAIELDTKEIFDDNWDKTRKDIVFQVLDGFRKVDDVVLYVPSNQEIRDSVKRIGEQLNLSGYQIGERISNGIGEIVAEVAAQNKELTGLVLTGGDTAKDTSRHLGGIGFRLMKQVEAGIPLGTLIGSDREFTVVTKAGAFGKENSIYKGMQELKGVQE